MRALVIGCVWLLAACAPAVLTSCGGDASDELKTVTGQVVEVEALSIDVFTRLSVRDDDGKLWTFKGGGAFTGFTPSHLAAHRAEQAPVTVTYREEADGSLRAIRLEDAPPD